MKLYFPIAILLLVLLWRQRNSKWELEEENETCRKIGQVGRVLNIIASIAIIAIPIVYPVGDMYNVYSTVKEEVMERGILDDTGASDEVKTNSYYSYNGLIMKVNNPDLDSIAYIDNANRQYEQWVDLSFPEYMVRMIWGNNGLDHVEEETSIKTDHAYRKFELPDGPVVIDRVRLKD